MNPKQSQYIMAVLRNGSFTAAAKELFISQPALSQTIRGIEKELGAPIFNRDSSPLQLTYAGKLYVEAMSRIMEIEKNLQREVDTHQNMLEGHLTLGLTRLYALYIIPKAIGIFHEKYPFVSVSVRENISTVLEREIIDGTCDIAIMTADVNHPQLVYQPIEQYRQESKKLAVLASSRAPIINTYPNGTILMPQQIASEHFVVPQPTSYARSIFDDMFHQIGVTPAVDVEVSTSDIAYRIVEQTSLITVATLSTLRMIQPKQLNIYPLNVELDNSSQLCVAHRKNMFLTGYMQDFINIIMDVTAQTDP